MDWLLPRHSRKSKACINELVNEHIALPFIHDVTSQFHITKKVCFVPVRLHTRLHKPTFSVAKAMAIPADGA